MSTRSQGRAVSGDSDPVILVITAAPDDRRSTSELFDLAVELDGRPGVRVAIWFLRDHRWGPTSEVPVVAGGTRTVDRLRTWRLASTMDAIGLGFVSQRLRGLRLRSWLRDLGPDVMVYDDGLGARVLDGWHRPTTTIARLNPVASADAEFEVAVDAADVWLAPPTVGPAEASQRIDTFAADLDDYRSWAALATPHEQRRLRDEAAIDPTVPLVTGWGGSGWVDGPELFIRVLWALEARHGRAVHGLWVGNDVDRHDRTRLEAEARRCGVGDRYHLVEGHQELHTCGDVVLLPYRAGGRPVAHALASGLEVVGFAALDIDDPAVTIVADLDVDAAAAAIDRALGANDRAARSDTAMSRLDRGRVADRLLALIQGHLA